MLKTQTQSKSNRKGRVKSLTIMIYCRCAWSGSCGGGVNSLSFLSSREGLVRSPPVCSSVLNMLRRSLAMPDTFLMYSDSSSAVEGACDAVLRALGSLKSARRCLAMPFSSSSPSSVIPLRSIDFWRPFCVLEFVLELLFDQFRIENLKVLLTRFREALLIRFTDSLEFYLFLRKII